LRRLIEWDAACRPLLEAIPAEERVALVRSKTEKWGAPNLRSLSGIESLADLLVTPAFIAHLRRIADESGEASEYAERIDALETKANAKAG
jgi:hypothetical protein